MKIERVLIIGGGIGGLTLALALNRAGIPNTVFERAPELKEVGAGVGMWANAFKVLDRLGAGDRVREIGMPLAVATLCTDAGRVLSVANLKEVVRGTQAACYVVHRAELHAALVRELPEGSIETDHECVGVEDTGASYVTAHFANGRSAKGTLVVGADGINSVVRAQLWGREKPRFSGQTAFRGVVHFDVPDKSLMREVHGAGKRFGICPMSKDRVYWYAAFNAPEGRMIDFDKRQERLLEEYRDWHWQAPEIIAATPSETILQNDLVDRVPIQRWSKGAITLLGDAAHPTTPNFGQGACMAIEDAIILTRHLHGHANLRDALQGYERERGKRTASIVKQSWMFGMVARWENHLAVSLRDLLALATPEFALRQTLRRQAGFDAGDIS